MEEIIIKSSFNFGDRFQGNMPEISDHAVMRARERFEVSKKNTRQWIQDNLIASKFINSILDKEGNPANLFINDDVMLYLSIDNKYLKTVMRSDRLTPSKHIKQNISSKIEQIIKLEIKRAQHSLRTTTYNNNLSIAELEIQRGNLKLKLLRARSEKNKNFYKKQIGEINDKINNMQQEIESVMNKNKQISLVAAFYMR